MIDLLIFYLSYWNVNYFHYSPTTVGLPQDCFGDASRLLANFFLHDYDKAIFEECERRNAKYLRFADDQIIFSPDSQTSKELLFFASKELWKLGLNINSSKVKEFSREEFEAYWAFDLFNLLTDKENASLIEKAAKKYLELDKNTFRWDSVLGRLLTSNLENIDISIKSKILSEALNDDYLCCCDNKNLKRIYLLLSNSEREKFLIKLKSLSKTNLFNSFHYYLLELKKDGINIDFEDELRARIKQLEFT